MIAASSALHRYVGFNPRTHGGYDTIQTYKTLNVKSFNPRTHGGYDMGSSLKEHEELMSFNTPVPTEGTMRSEIIILPRFGCFNPRTHGGYDF